MQPKLKYWTNDLSLFDAGSGNGIQFWKPPGDSVAEFVRTQFRVTNYWNEVSVLGHIYPYDYRRNFSK